MECSVDLASKGVAPFKLNRYFMSYWEEVYSKLLIKYRSLSSVAQKELKPSTLISLTHVDDSNARSTNYVVVSIQVEIECIESDNPCD
jgi:hypothetical protein